MERYQPKSKKKPKRPYRKGEVAKAASPIGGRPPIYEPRFASIAQKLCSLGATDADLATAFKVTTQSIWLWQKKYPEFKDAVRAGKADIFDPMVERSLAQRAIGYAVDIEEVKVLSSGQKVRYQVRKHYPPDPTSCIFWLKNRQPDKWRDVYDHNHVKKEEDNLTAEQLKAELIKDAVELGLLPEQMSEMTKTVAAGVVPNGKSKLN